MFVFSGIKYSKLLTFAKTIFLYKHEQTFNFTLQILSTYTCQFIIKDFILFQVLAKKMTVLYKLAREQLSKQSHYDFGLRALKSVLVMAGELKRGSPDLSEVETPQHFPYNVIRLTYGSYCDLWSSRNSLKLDAWWKTVRFIYVHQASYNKKYCRCHLEYERIHHEKYRLFL